MFDSTDKAAAIREIQRYLLEISYGSSYLPHVWVDGIYGPRTREAIRAFQDRYQLPMTGVVNATTWALLYQKFDEARSKRQAREIR